ncbi:MAG: single-stranded DNA-binding protein [Oscillospiraceae bacterium]|nr:single-stranded DNA-binding protein [Oscillospiraceae bacterium]
MMGRIVTDLELKTTPQGVSVCTFRIAVDRNFQKKGEERKSDFFNVVAWRQNGEFISRYFSKGKPILIEGELNTRQYTDKNGNPSTWYEIVVDRQYFVGNKGDGSSGSYSQSGDPGYGTPPPASSSFSAPADTGSADFSSADSDDYPF